MVLNWSCERIVVSKSRPSPGSVSSGSGACENSARAEEVRKTRSRGGWAIQSVRVPRASVEVLETFEHPLHCVADAVVIID